MLATKPLTQEVWAQAQQDLDLARRELASAPAGVFRQSRYDRMLAAERHATDLVHAWLGAALKLQPVRTPRMVLSLDVDGVLEDESQGFSSTGMPGAAALKLLQLGGVAVLLNTARSMDEVRARSEHFQLLGGVSAFGATIWDGVFDRQQSLVHPRAEDQLARLRSTLRANSEVVIDPLHDASLRVSRVRDGVPAAIVGPDARRLLDRLELDHLTFWVAPRYTDFVDRGVDKALGVERLRQALGLGALPLAAMGDASCDVPMLRLARQAFLPAATLPSYVAPRGQRLVRSRHLGDQSVWEAACQLVPDASLHREVATLVQEVEFPEWLPGELRRVPTNGKRFFPRIAAAFTSMRRTD
jgi:3-deoxy-D-manno-octulosonate 8-phosphate phosphatase KdsC-like HAD superfamily phosphatase